MSPASKGADSSPQEPESAAEVTEETTAVAAEQAVESAVVSAPAAKEAEAAAADASEADASEADASEDDAQEAGAKPARRRATAASAAKQPADSGAAAKPARTRAAKAPAKPAAKKAKAAAASTEVKVDLPADIFDAKVNVPLIHQVVVAQQAAARQGTHATKTRGDVRGGGKKPYRQKGTGRARQGSIRAPQFTGGGIVHGPVSRSHAQKTPKKMKAAALRGALSDRARHGLVQVVGGFVDGDAPRTTDAVSMLTAVTGAAAGTAMVLVVADAKDQITWKSLRNARGVHLIDPGQLNTYDVLTSDRVVFTSAAYESFVARVGAAGRQKDEKR
jgi:large subunit ribosomal protein L4